MQKFKLHSSAVLAAILLLCAVSCQQPTHKVEEVKIKRKYDVRLSNHIGSDWYECDSIIRLSEDRLQLKNNEDSSYFIDIAIPANVVVRVYPK
jgi:hypothetical protein